MDKVCCKLVVYFIFKYLFNKIDVSVLYDMMYTFASTQINLDCSCPNINSVKIKNKVSSFPENKRIHATK